MANKVLAILEVSQKQAYIFSSNKLRDNVMNSAVIAWVMSSEYFEQVIRNKEEFCREKNLVSQGGGHTILEFETKSQAVSAVKKITGAIHREYSEIEVFAVVREFEDEKPVNMLEKLTASLEKKKAERKAAFRQGSFGIESVDNTTLKPIFISSEKKTSELPENEERIDRELIPNGYKRVWSFEDLGGEKNKSNFIAVVHIDGNAMGARVKQLYDKIQDESWENFKQRLQQFSDAIDRDFKSAYLDMANIVAANLSSDSAKAEEEKRFSSIKLKDGNFPIRRIITAGDDICFVSEGRIGIECARIFIQCLEKKVNEVDKKGYAACAGVAIVHRKYPFYRAYELAELLCSNAKKFGVNYSADKSGSDVSAIDWHIEFGEVADSLGEIREKYDVPGSDEILTMRPYIVSETGNAEREKIRRYEKIKTFLAAITSPDFTYARGHLKELRTMLKQGEIKTRNYIKFYKLEPLFEEGYYNADNEFNLGESGVSPDEKPIFVECKDGTKRSYIYDAIELMDTFIALDN